MTRRLSGASTDLSLGERIGIGMIESVIADHEGRCTGKAPTLLQATAGSSDNEGR